MSISDEQGKIQPQSAEQEIWRSRREETSEWGAKDGRNRKFVKNKDSSRQLRCSRSLFLSLSLFSLSAPRLPSTNSPALPPCSRRSPLSSPSHPPSPKEGRQCDVLFLKNTKRNSGSLLASLSDSSLSCHLDLDLERERSPSPSPRLPRCPLLPSPSLSLLPLSLRLVRRR